MPNKTITESVSELESQMAAGDWTNATTTATVIEDIFDRNDYKEFRNEAGRSFREMSYQAHHTAAMQYIETAEGLLLRTAAAFDGLDIRDTYKPIEMQGLLKGLIDIGQNLSNAIYCANRYLASFRQPDQAVNPFTGMQVSADSFLTTITRLVSATYFAELDGLPASPEVIEKLITAYTHLIPAYKVIADQPDKRIWDLNELR